MSQMTEKEEAMYKAQGSLSRAQDEFQKAVKAVLKEKIEARIKRLKETGFAEVHLRENLLFLARIAFDLGRQVAR